MANKYHHTVMTKIVGLPLVQDSETSAVELFLTFQNVSCHLMVYVD